MRVRVETIGIGDSGVREFEAEFSGGTIEDLVGHLVETLSARGTSLPEHQRRLMKVALIIVNGEVVSEEEKAAVVLREGDCVTFALPMAGG